MKQVSKSYPTQGEPLVILQNVSLSQPAGSSLAIVGPSGSGKSTLLHLMGALDTPTSGQVLIDGVDITPLTENQRAKLRNEKIGFVFQDHHLLPQCTVLENVLVPALAQGTVPNSLVDRARDYIQQVGLEARREHRPAQLSGGERQRCAIARALLLQPNILLCDEPTGNLDAETAGRIVDLLFELHQRLKTVLIMVTHAEELAKRADQIARLQHRQVTLEPGRG